MTEFTPVSTEGQPSFAANHARQFIGWMFKDISPERIAQIPEADLPALFDILAENAVERLKTIKDWRRKKQMQTPIELMKRWVEGRSFSQIYQATGKSEDSTRFALMSFAERAGGLEDLEQLVSGAKGRAQAISQLAELPEPFLKPAEAEPSQPAEINPNSLQYSRPELVRWLLDAVAALPPLEEYPLTAGPARSALDDHESKKLFDEFPMMARVSQTDKLDQMLKDAGII